MDSLREQISAHNGHRWPNERTMLLRVQNYKADIVLVPRSRRPTRCWGVYGNIPAWCQIKRLYNRRVYARVTSSGINQRSYLNWAGNRLLCSGQGHPAGIADAYETIQQRTASAGLEG